MLFVLRVQNKLRALWKDFPIQGISYYHFSDWTGLWNS